MQTTRFPLRFKKGCTHRMRVSGSAPDRARTHARTHVLCLSVYTTPALLVVQHAECAAALVHGHYTFAKRFHSQLHADPLVFSFNSASMLRIRIKAYLERFRSQLHADPLAFSFSDVYDPVDFTGARLGTWRLHFLLRLEYTAEIHV